MDHLHIPTFDDRMTLKHGLLLPNTTPLENFPKLTVDTTSTLLDTTTVAYFPPHLKPLTHGNGLGLASLPTITNPDPVLNAHWGLGYTNYFEVRRCCDNRIVYYAWLVPPHQAQAQAQADHFDSKTRNRVPRTVPTILPGPDPATSVPSPLVGGPDSKPVGWNWLYFCGAQHYSINPTQQPTSACAIGQWNASAILAHVKQHDPSAVVQCPMESCVFGPRGGTRAQFGKVGSQLEHHLFAEHRMTVEGAAEVMEEVVRETGEGVKQRARYCYTAFDTKQVVVQKWEGAGLAHPNAVIHTIGKI